MKRIISFILTILLFLTFVLPNEIIDAKTINNYTGEELFEGIYFGNGKVAQKFPEIWGRTEFKHLTKDKLFKKGIKDIEKDLKKNDINYFINLKNSVTSGNQLIIKEQLNKTNSDILNICEKKYKTNLEPRGIKPGFVVALAYSYVAATHIVAAGAVTVIVVGTKIYIKGRSTDNVLLEEGLSQERYINLISERLSH